MSCVISRCGALSLVLAASFVLVGCGSSGHLDRPDINQMATGPNVSGPRDGVYLRASFDDDPSMFIGRFVSDTVAASDVDENRGVQTACSQFITYREVRAAGEFDEYYQSSTSVKASLGVDPGTVAGLTAAGAPKGQGQMGNEQATEVRVKYNLSRKLVAHIEDHDAYTSCCEAAAGRCSGKYIGEFWAGTGTMYQITGRATDVGAGLQGGTAGVQGTAGVEIADGWAWRRAMSFDDLYFAFRVMDAEIGGCAWADRPPSSDEGQYFVGISPPAATEDMARTFAMRNARTQVVAFLGEYIETRTTSRAGLKGYLDDEHVVAAAAEGLAARVKDERYCPAERIDTPDGSLFLVKVLAYFPDAEARAAAKEIVQAVAEQTGDAEITAVEEGLDEEE